MGAKKTDSGSNKWKEQEMGTLSIWHWLIVIVVMMLFFGRGRISTLMGDVGKGIRALRHELRDIDETKSLAPEGEIHRQAATRVSVD
ncbi:Sec-independent protein secretion pathway component [Mesorhizobium australicum WSM2073]|uniref:Sec-independent protein translocase protein TatA n=1 Tax=Mesorhizobium australicum (strain HAMBI 3006 / LMG 24608 / WSM2073) TaxID=754035 RepID=L0KCM2_MESAW|nr:Sec-independent protein secretion pathway component [Mesorhizobium australicum WSM2073]